MFSSERPSVRPSMPGVPVPLPLSQCWPHCTVPPHGSFTSLAPLLRRYVAKAFRKICIALRVYWYLSLFSLLLPLCFAKSVLDFIGFCAAVLEAVKEQHGTPMSHSSCLLLLIFYFIYSLSSVVSLGLHSFGAESHAKPPVRGSIAVQEGHTSHEPAERSTVYIFGISWGSHSWGSLEIRQLSQLWQHVTCRVLVFRQPRVKHLQVTTPCSQGAA